MPQSNCGCLVATVRSTPFTPLYETGVSYNTNTTITITTITCTTTTITTTNLTQPPPLFSLVGMQIDPDRACRVTVEVGFNSTLHNDYGAPSTVSVVYDIASMAPKMNVTLTWHNKTTTRLSEATTIFHRPKMRKGYIWEMDKLGEWVAASNVTKGGMQYQHAVWSGIRYVSVEEKTGLWIHTLDAGLVCPLLNEMADPALTPEVSLQKSCDKYNIKDVQDPHYQIQLRDAMISGIGIHLHGNLFDISGFPQWYPFGVGDSYQEEDAMEQFRFVFEEK